ncbi:MAG: surface polysaccharide O-acyltransferase-like enzyme [Roseivirga sp.]|jgi:surface polysaccharide O-acyltransferase-like enzyme
MQRYQSIDLLKVVLVLLVVATHSSFLYDYSQAMGHAISNGLVRVVVPLFLIFSGYFSERAFREGKALSWIKRVAILYVIWMLVYFPYWVDIDEFNLFRSVIDLIFGFHHLHYISSLLGGGVILYFLKGLSDRALLISALLLFLAGVFVEYAGEYNLFINILMIDEFFGLNFSHRNFLFIGFPFLTVGYLIKKAGFEQKIKKRTLVILLVISATIFAVESVLLYFRLSGRYGGFDVYLMSLFICPIIFILTLNLNLRPKKFNTKSMALYLAAIYFIHPIFIINYSKVFDFDSITLMFLTLISSLIASYFIILVHKRFKYIL